MNKLFTFLTGMALIGSLSACSNDEPVKNPDQGNTGDESTFYLNVRIVDAQSTSRADDNRPDYGYEDGNENEHKVKTAHFFFFNEQKIFIKEVSIWNADSNLPGDKDNIELESNNQVILKNLTEKELPTYLITVLNAPDALINDIRGSVLTMDEVRNKIYNCLNSSKDEDNKDNDYFVMSTSCFKTNADINETATDAVGIIHHTRYNKDVYWANRLDKSDFKKEPKDQLTKGDDVIDIYVERLAAKFSTKLDNSIFPVNVTIAGNENTEIDGSGVAATKVWVKILNFGVTGTEKKSYLSKNLDNPEYTYNNNPWNGWNDITRYRSFWARSVNYGAAPDLNYKTLDYPVFNDVNGSLDGTKAVYANETTNNVAKLQNNENDKYLNVAHVTNYVFTAKIYEDEACTKELKLVKFGGVMYKIDQFKKFILRSLTEQNKLNFYRLVTTSTENEDGSTSVKNEWTQINENDIDFVKEGLETGIVKLTSTIIGNDTKLYEKNSTEPIEDAINKLNTNLNFLFKTGANDFNYPESFNAMYYTVPVEHLNWVTTERPAVPTITAEGEYGVVRNHWYQLTVDNIFNLGNGVFDPDSDEGDRLIPKNPTPESFAMGARIKILSWKIVKQNVDL